MRFTVNFITNIVLSRFDLLYLLVDASLLTIRVLLTSSSSTASEAHKTRVIYRYSYASALLTASFVLTFSITTVNS